ATTSLSLADVHLSGNTAGGTLTGVATVNVTGNDAAGPSSAPTLPVRSLPSRTRKPEEWRGPTVRVRTTGVALPAPGPPVRRTLGRPAALPSALTHSAAALCGISPKKDARAPPLGTGVALHPCDQVRNP